MREKQTGVFNPDLPRLEANGPKAFIKFAYEWIYVCEPKGLTQGQDPRDYMSLELFQFMERQRVSVEADYLEEMFANPIGKEIAGVGVIPVKILKAPAEAEEPIVIDGVEPINLVEGGDNEGGKEQSSTVGHGGNGGNGGKEGASGGGDIAGEETVDAKVEEESGEGGGEVEEQENKAQSVASRTRKRANTEAVGGRAAKRRATNITATQIAQQTAVEGEISIINETMNMHSESLRMVTEVVKDLRRELEMLKGIKDKKEEDKTPMSVAHNLTMH